MWTIGVDAHKRRHAAVAVDRQGQERGQWQGANTPAGWQAVLDWATALGAVGVWGVEGSGQHGQGLAQWLVAQGQQVVEVNPRLTAGMRRGSRQPGKSDRLDALAVARVVVQEGADLPVVQASDATSVLAVLVGERQGAVAEATRLRNQLHPVLHALDPARTWPGVTSLAGVTQVRRLRPATGTPVQVAQWALVRRMTARLALVLAQVATLTQEIEALAGTWLAPLEEIVGVGPLTAGMLAAALGPGARFATDAQLASYAGVAPLVTGSAGVERHRLNRTGNRQLNCLCHRIALTQARCSPEARAYLLRKRTHGRSEREAIRSLKRFIIRRIFHAWQRCSPPELLPLT